MIEKALGTIALGGLLLASCVDPVRAKQDYDRYPTHKKEIALYNIGRIFEDNCLPGTWRVYDDGVECKNSFCKERTYNQSGIGQCGENITLESNTTWSKISYVRECGHILGHAGWAVCVENSDGTTLYFKTGDQKQTDELIEAMNIYRRGF